MALRRVLPFAPAPPPPRLSRRPGLGDEEGLGVLLPVWWEALQTCWRLPAGTTYTAGSSPLRPWIRTESIAMARRAPSGWRALQQRDAPCAVEIGG